LDSWFDDQLLGAFSRSLIIFLASAAPTHRMQISASVSRVRTIHQPAGSFGQI
jgi:hypothetical protein